MLIAKLFLPMASPGLAAVGLGILSVASGAYNAAEVVAIILGLGVVAIAGVFTIRSNVAKIWREQAEGEKARNLDLTEQLADVRLSFAAELADVVKKHAGEAAQLQAEIDKQRDLKHGALADLAAQKMLTDQTPVITLLKQILAAVTTSAHIEVTGEAGGPVKFVAADGDGA